MSLPSYDQYKFCKADWLDALPDHWKLVRIRNLFEIKKRIVGELGYDVIAITQQGVKIKDLEATTGQFSMDYSKYQLVEIGDFAMNHMDLLTGYIDISPFRGVTSPDYRVFSSLDEAPVCNRYFLYLFQHCYRQKIFFAYGQGSSQLGRWRFPTDEFRNFYVPLPSLNEQNAIASFLDRETAKIDDLVAEQERLIALLKEKRQAVISHAVTKGLNPDLPMKDSGVEWLGEVPAHWSVVRCKHQLNGIEQGWSPQAEARVVAEGEWGVLKAGCVNRGIFDDLQHKALDHIPAERVSLKVSTGDLLMSRASGSKELIGSVALVKDCRFNLIISDKIFRLHLDRNSCEEQYFYWCFQSQNVRRQIELAINGAEGLANNITKFAIGEITIALPEPNEQAGISRYLSGEVKRIGLLVSEAEKAVSLLRERRAALVSAAVAGKIDVRGLVDTEEAA